MGAILIAAAAVLLVDQLSKGAVVGGWHRSRSPASTGHRWRLAGLWALAVAGSLLYAGVAMPAGAALPHVGLGCAIGGATSNLLDRLWRGGVVDFIAVGFWPIFNLADVAIVGGVLLAVGIAG